jgi:hypothetical protein
LSLDEESRFRMASRCHAERISICPAKKSLHHPFRVEIIIWTITQGSSATSQPWANFHSAFSAFEFAFVCFAVQNIVTIPVFQ